MEYGISASRVIPQASGVSILQSHADYSLAELIGALEDKPLKDMISLPREGVRYIEKLRTDLFLVTFKKRAGTSAAKIGRASCRERAWSAGGAGRGKKQKEV